ncbi:type II secretion system protein GspJ [Opitutus sp. GAS368]|uniref:type II secretion system protein GspJ n=1 Tax=Opitutus sp. GAS368 TaxID=1882749 RepID=UPI00087A1DD4|nr:type II secretion system protein GspJ [Opitutus sp. GAS368]SDS36906.1 type II secretion system protein J [Opitutus sp. GAS368]
MTFRRSSSPRSPAAGFTLIEILLATLVGAIVLLVINGTFFGALRLSNTTEASIASGLELDRALGIVRRDLGGVMLPGNGLAGPLQTTLASSLSGGTYGDQVGASLFTNSGTIDGWNPFSEVQMVEYYLAPANDGTNRRNLLRVVTRNLLPVQTATTDVQTLLTGVADVTMDYYDGTAWTDSWDSTVTSTMPTAIRFQVTLARADPQQPAPAPIELLVPVLVTTNASQAAAASGETGT